MKPIFSNKDYVYDQFRGVSYPFGFPEIENSVGKKYIIDLSLTGQPETNDYIAVYTSGGSQIYRINKSQLLKHPDQIISIFTSRIQNIINNKTALTTIFLALPGLILIIYLNFENKKNKKSKKANFKK